MQNNVDINSIHFRAENHVEGRNWFFKYKCYLIDWTVSVIHHHWLNKAWNIGPNLADPRPKQCSDLYLKRNEETTHSVRLYTLLLVGWWNCLYDNKCHSRSLLGHVEAHSSTTSVQWPTFHSKRPGFFQGLLR